METVQFYMWLHTATIGSTAGNKTKFSPSPFHTFLPPRGSLWPKAFGSDHVAACSTVSLISIEENESGGYVSILCPSKKTQLSSTVDWLKF